MSRLRNLASGKNITKFLNRMDRRKESCSYTEKGLGFKLPLMIGDTFQNRFVIIVKLRYMRDFFYILAEKRNFLGLK